MIELIPLSKHDHPEPMTTVWSETEIRAIQNYAHKCIAAEHKRLLACTLEPVASVSIGDKPWNYRLATIELQHPLRAGSLIYTSDQLAAARLQDQQHIAELEAQIDNIKHVEFPKRVANVVEPLKRKIADLEAQLAARKLLTDEQMFEMVETAWRHGWASCRDSEYVGKEAEDERWGLVGAEVVQDIAAHGIKEGGAA